MLEVLDRHPHANAVLRAAVPPEGAPSHAYLFHGPAGAGKREAARAFAAELLAEGAADPDDARRRAVQGVHPDLTWVTPSGAAEMLVGDIDEPVVAAPAGGPARGRGGVGGGQSGGPGRPPRPAHAVRGAPARFRRRRRRHDERA